MASFCNSVIKTTWNLTRKRKIHSDLEMILSPILLYAYNRPQHLRRCVESLLANNLAKASEVFVFSDAAKNEKDVEAVSEVRKYIHEMSGFGTIHIIERKENWGLARSIIDGVTTVIAEYGRVIVVEDDLVVSPYFLLFMKIISRKQKQYSIVDLRKNLEKC